MAIKCGDCLHFIRNGKCGWHESKDAEQKHSFAYAPFWVWSDALSDKEQVRADVTSACPTFSKKDAGTAHG